jgi:hypothetical protein
VTADRVGDWLIIETLLRRVLHDHSAALDVRETTLVLDWLDHNELGLAAEILSDRVGACPDLDRALALMALSSRPM